MRRPPGEEDEVGPEGRIPQPEPNPVLYGSRGPIASAQTHKPSYGPTQQPRPETRKPSLKPTCPAQPTCTFPSAGPACHPRIPKTRERSNNPRLAPRPLHTRRPLVVPRGTSAARLPSAAAAQSARQRLLGSGSLFGSGNLFPACLSPFRPSRT